MEKTAAREALTRHLQKEGEREFITTEGELLGPQLSDYANRVRNFELGGAGLGALGGAAVGSILSKGRLPGYLLGGAGGGLLGKGVGRNLGEEVGMRQLGADIGVPLEADPSSRIVQR
jgi:hypothetical protein